MKATIKTTIIGFLAGLIGAFVYHQFIQNTIPYNEDRLMTEDELNNVLQKKMVSQEIGTPDSPAIASDKSYTIKEKENFVNASKRSTPSVVYIKTMSEQRYASTWMEWFFGERGSQAISTGSGVIYSSDGYVVTNNHVIEGAADIEVKVGKRTYPAEVKGSDPSTDLAVLKIDAKNLPNINLGDSRNVEVGEWVLAVGNPFNLTSTVTAGIVSAKGRDLNILETNFPIEAFIQTDAAINPGNSGGALVNMNGDLIGINTAIISKTGSYAGYGFAVPSDIVKKVTEDIIQYGMVQKAYFGGEVFNIDSKIANEMDIDNYEGVVLGYLSEDGAAASAGMQKGDIILAINGEKVNSKSEFEELLSYRSPGDKITVTYKRNSNKKTTNITLTNKEGTTKLLERKLFTSESLSADFEKVSKVERDRLNIDTGVKIVNVRSGFVQQMGLPEGFIICYINKITIDTPEKLADILERIKGRVLVEGINKRGQWEYYRYYF